MSANRPIWYIPICIKAGRASVEEWIAALTATRQTLVQIPMRAKKLSLVIVEGKMWGDPGSNLNDSTCNSGENKSPPN